MKSYPLWLDFSRRTRPFEVCVQFVIHYFEIWPHARNYISNAHVHTGAYTHAPHPTYCTSDFVKRLS